MTKSFLISAIFTAFLIGFFALPANAASLNVTGYAWSDNVGWIQFDPVFGGVSFDTATGNLSGYAWSDSIGWIDFNPSGPYPGAPNYSAKMDPVTGIGSGWLRAILGGTAGSGGWDGWIKMAGTADDGGSYGVVVDPSTGQFSGFAWGSDVAGWIDFKPSVSFGGVIVPPWIPGVNLSVVLSAVPNAGNIPLNVNLSANVGGTAVGTINYHLWWDCDDAGTNPAIVALACGNLPAPAPGACLTNANGMKCEAVNDNPETVNYTYSSAGNYNAKVIAERGASPAVEDREAITVLSGSSLPTAPSNLSADAVTDCEKIDLTWTDNSGDETSFEILRTGGGPNATYTVGANTEFYQDIAVVVGANYAYQVRACNASGCSAYSNSANAVPVACAAFTDYTLAKDGDIFVTLMDGAGAESSKTNICVINPQNFSDSVSLTSDASSAITGATDTFSLNPIPPPYGACSNFSVFAPTGTAQGLYTITVTGDGNGLIRQVDVLLNVVVVKRKWWQF